MYLDIRQLAQETVRIHKSRIAKAFILRLHRNPRVAVELLTTDKCKELVMAVKGGIMLEQPFNWEAMSRIKPERIAEDILF